MGSTPAKPSTIHIASVELVGLLDLRLGEPPHAGHLAVKIVGLRGPVARDRKPRLRLGDGGVGVRVHHAANTVAPGAVDGSMRCMSEDGRRSPSTTLPSRSQTTSDSGVSSS